MCVHLKKSKGPLASRAYRGTPGLQMPGMQMPGMQMSTISYPQVQTKCKTAALLCQQTQASTHKKHNNTFLQQHAMQMEALGSSLAAFGQQQVGAHHHCSCRHCHHRHQCYNHRIVIDIVIVIVVIVVIVIMCTIRVREGTWGIRHMPGKLSMI